MNIYHWMLLAGWLLFSGIHSIMAALWFKDLVQRQMGRYFKWYRSVYSLVAFVTLGLLLFYQFSHRSYLLFRPERELIIAALLFSVVGVGVMLVSGRKYLVAISGIGAVTQQEVHKLEQDGLHRLVRHPIYSGTLLMIWSLFFIFPLLSNGIACAVITTYTLAGILLEERKLILEFGDSYVQYAKRTPRLIPYFGTKR